MTPFQDLSISNAPFMRELEAAASRVLRSGRYINGPEVHAFESELAGATGVDFCVAVSTGLDALRLILKGYMEMGRLREGDEVIVPANTFIATFLAVSDCRLVPVAADVDASTFCLDFTRLPLSDKTRAIIPVHLFGTPCWNADVIARLRSRGILVIEDNAQALGASVGSMPTGSLGDAAAVSFYPAKNIGACGDAGAVLTSDAALAETVRMLANYGSRERYRHELLGANCRMDELQAALLRVKLPRLGEITARRNAVARAYDSLISNPEVIKPHVIEDKDTVQAWHQYVVRHPRRDSLRAYLQENGIGTEIHYPVVCTSQPCYAGGGIRMPEGGVPVASSLAGEILSLPIADVSDSDVERIASLINAY